MAAKIKKGDKVVVLTGKYKGVEAEVLEVRPKESRVVVRGVAVAKKHQKQTPQNQGGIVSIEQPIHISNVAYSAGGKPSRVGFRIDGDKKVRVAKKTGEAING